MIVNVVFADEPGGPGARAAVLGTSKIGSGIDLSIGPCTKHQPNAGGR